MVHPNRRFNRGDLFRFLLLFCFLVAWGVARGADRATPKQSGQPSDADIGAPTVPTLQAEMDAHHLADDLVQARLRLIDLGARRADAVLAARALAKTDHEGIALFQRYLKLLAIRYADEEGTFNPAAELSADDVTNLNQIFDHYLHHVPFAAQWGKISAGFAHDTIHKGIDRLEEIAGTHEDPSPENNSDLEILAFQTRTEKDAIERLLATADHQGVKLDPNAPLPENSRLPAASN